MIKTPRIEECVLATDLTVDKWPNNCYAIACAIVQAGLVPGAQPAYGHYFGHVADSSIFAGRVAPRHGWILHKQAEVIIDPTRWVFEDVDPYIFSCEKHEVPKWEEYDLGGEQFQALYGPGRRFPTDEICVGDHKYEGLAFPEPAAAFVKDAFGHHEWLYREQVFWLANCSPNNLEDLAPLIYDTIMAEPGRVGMIPLDYRHFVYGTGDLA